MTVTRKRVVAAKKAGHLTLKRLQKRTEEIKVLIEEVTKWINNRTTLFARRLLPLPADMIDMPYDSIKVIFTTRNIIICIIIRRDIM
jgi:hypothetical protein